MKDVETDEAGRIPSRAECMKLMEQQAMPENIRRHSLLVCEVARLLGRALASEGVQLDIDLIEAAALLHDIGKAQALRTKEDHAVLGATLLCDLGYSRLAPIVRDHIGLRTFEPGKPLTESLVVNYSDKRVKHDGVASLEDRFEDLGERYVRNSEMQELLEQMLDAYTALQREIFTRLPFTPGDVARLVGPGRQDRRS